MKKKTLESRRKRQPLLFLAPWLLGTAVFFLFPVFYSLAISFSNLENPSTLQMTFAGLEHYHHALFVDTGFVGYLLEIFKTTITQTPVVVIFSLFIAILVNRKFPGRGLFRTVFFLPVILGPGFVMEQLMDQGLQEEAMKVVSQLILQDDVILYLGEKGTSFVQGFLSLLTQVFWRSGVQIVIFLAGLQKIPVSLYEAARIDAASSWETLWYITLPLISPMILLNVVFTFVDYFTDSSNVVMELLNYLMFTYAQFEYAAAAGWLYFLLIFIIMGITWLILRPFVRNTGM